MLNDKIDINELVAYFLGADEKNTRKIQDKPANINTYTGDAEKISLTEP